MTAPVGFNMEMAQFSPNAKFLLPPHGNPYSGKPVRNGGDLPEPGVVAASQNPLWVDRLHTLATKTGISLLADFYRSTAVHGADGEPDLSQDPAFQALDAFSRPEGYAWWMRGKSLLLRKRDWYNQRLYEVPDRWLEAVSRRVSAHKAALTYADVLTLSELSRDQIIGLNQSLGLSTNRDLLSGLREMLASLAGCAINKNTPLYKGDFGGANGLKQAVHPNINAAEQATLLNSFLRAFPRDLMEEIRREGGDSGDFGYLVTANADAAAEKPGAPVQINVVFTIHGGVTAGYLLGLPTALPDDRRANTQITLTP